MLPSWLERTRVMPLPIPVAAPKPTPPATSATAWRTVPAVAGVGVAGTVATAVMGTAIGWSILVGIVAAGATATIAMLWLARRAARRAIQIVRDQEHNRVYKRLEKMTLAVYRSDADGILTKDELVQAHGFHPDEADWALSWLVAHDLIVSDWDQLEGPAVYRRTHAGLEGGDVGPAA